MWSDALYGENRHHREHLNPHPNPYRRFGHLKIEVRHDAMDCI